MIKAASITLNVSDLDRSVAFYESLGFAMKNRWGNHYAMLSAPGLELGLHPTDAVNIAGNSGNASIGLTSTDFDAVGEALKEQGIDFTKREEEGGRFLHFSDPDGTSLYFIEPKW